LPAGDYELSTEAPATGYVGSRTLAQITLAPNGSAGERFGFQAIGTVAGTIFRDGDGNGRQGAGERGLGGVVVTLNSQETAAVAAPITAVTASDGSFTFSGLAAGNYQLVVTAPAGYGATAPATINFALSATGMDAALAVSVGFASVDQVSGRVFADLNKNGVQEPSELGVSGANLTLSGNGSTDRSVQSSVDGTFLLTGVPNGVYRATLALPPNHTATTALETTVTVDGVGAATVRFGVRPNLPNQAPVLAALNDIAFHLSQFVSIAVNGSDADDTVLSYSASGLPDGLAINPSSGLISGQLAVGAVGQYLITVTVTDPQGATAQRSFTLAVMTPTNLGDEEEEPGLTEQLYLPFATR
jgi:hypothetical protein